MRLSAEGGNQPASPGHTLAGLGLGRLAWVGGRGRTPAGLPGEASDWSRMAQRTEGSSANADSSFPWAHLPLGPALGSAGPRKDISTKRGLGAIPQSPLRSPGGLERSGGPCRGGHEAVETSAPSTGSEPDRLGSGCRPPNPKPQRAPHPSPAALWNVSPRRGLFQKKVVVTERN